MFAEKVFISMFVFCMLLTFTVPAKLAGQPKIAYTKPLNPNILKRKSLSELWLMRNEIYAHHGRPFRTYELHSYFMSTGWYHPNDKYSNKILSSVEVDNANLIKKEEEKRCKKNYYSKNDKTYVNFDNVLNKFQFSKFTTMEIEKLSQNGFVVLPTEYNQLFHIYENNDYLGVPSFITVDAVLQLYHLFFDMTLRNLEQKYLSQTLKKLCDQVLKHSEQVYMSVSDAKIKKAAFNSMIYFSIPYYFVSDEKLTLKNEAKELALQEINLCKTHSPWTDSPLLGRKFDYSQFIPRGHYTRNDTLRNYFMAMMWLGFAGIEIKNDIQLIQGLIVTHNLYTKKVDGTPLIKLWKNIYEPTVFYVGLVDDLGPDDFKEAMDQVLGQNPNLADFSDPPILSKIREILTKKFKEKTKITGHGAWGSQGPQFRFMGQRFIPDSYIFQRLTIRNPERKYFRSFPNGLDIMAVFGSETAKKLMLTELKQTWSDWPEYPQELKKLISEYSKLGERQWRQNLYYNWLWCLNSLLVLKDENRYPFFMKTEGWERKSLNTALGSWSELRHDVILYAKQSCVAECGGGGEEVKVWIPEPPKGYVEPNVKFYQRLLQLLTFTRDELSSCKMIDIRMKNLFNRFVELVEFLKKVSIKELKNYPRTLQEYEQIQKMGSLLDNMTLTVLSDDAPDWSWIEGPDKDMPVIADVHTADFEVLEVGVGKAHEMYVIVEIDGKLKLTRGAIFSYYEFPWPSDDRLTDEKWQEILEKGEKPALPDWSNYYRSPEKKQKPLRPLYLPVYEGIPKWSTEPGWKLLYYESGC